MQRSGLNPADFHWTISETDALDGAKEFHPSLEHLTEEAMFFAVGLDPSAGEYSGLDAPAKHNLSEWFDDVRTWTSIQHFSIEWLEASKHQLQGDLWEKLGAQRAMFSAVVASGENTPLSEPEQKRLHASIDELLANVKEQGLFPREQYLLLQAAMTHQKKAAGWLGRVDWVNGFIGAVLGQLLTIASNPKAVEGFLHLAASAVSWLSGHLSQLPSKF